MRNAECGMRNEPFSSLMMRRRIGAIPLIEN
jgi:hypothetical protein